jgi:hypothetical protein
MKIKKNILEYDLHIVRWKSIVFRRNRSLPSSGARRNPRRDENEADI